MDKQSELPYATVDLDRANRCGFPEVIFCEGKQADWIEGIARKLRDAGQAVFGTRLNESQAAHLAKAFPHAAIDRIGRTFLIDPAPPARVGDILVVTAGTGDLPVAREAMNTAMAMGCNADLIVDVGVAGLHRILKHRDRLNNADVLIVVAGMDGALPSVVGGLVECPVIAVPTSIGYGAAFGGLAPLLTMLNSCSAGVVTVNIDAGFKAGYAAARLVKRMHRRSVE